MSTVCAIPTASVDAVGCLSEVLRVIAGVLDPTLEGKESFDEGLC